LSLATMSLDVSLGAPAANQVLASAPCLQTNVAGACFGKNSPLVERLGHYVECWPLQTHPGNSQERQNSIPVANPATFLSNCLRQRPWPWASPLLEIATALRADPMPPSSPYDLWPAARRRPCRRRSGSCQRILQVDDVAGIARFQGRSYRLTLALLGSATR
jgi:hypothetical protein